MWNNSIEFDKSETHDYQYHNINKYKQYEQISPIISNMCIKCLL